MCMRCTINGLSLLEERERSSFAARPGQEYIKKRPGPKEGRLFTEVEGLSDNLRFDDSM